MTPLYQWAERHNIPPAALQDLLATLGLVQPPDVPVPTSGAAHSPHVKSEAAVQQQVRLAAARRGDMTLFRNNVGACEDKDGRVIRYGLCNESSQMNARIKSSDLVGLTRVVCRCGWVHGVFTAFEVKHPGWHLTPGDKRGNAQWEFGKMIIARGGIFRFVTRAEDIHI